MSTVYRILCLSHDPAIILEPDWNNPEQAIAAATNPDDYIEVAPHSSCDLLVGGFSYPLISVACPPRPHPGQDAAPHRQPIWITKDWLHVLAAANQLPHADLAAALRRLPGCWSPTRIHRLRNLLEPAPVAEPIAI